MRLRSMLATVVTPTAVVDADRVLANLARMTAKAERSGATLRPHVKTHNSLRIGRLLRAAGVDRITVSSIAMARRFADDGWDDVVIAFPLNVRALNDVVALAAAARLGVTVDSVATADALVSRTDATVDVWIEIDTGYGRTGVPVTDDATVVAIARRLARAGHLRLAGLSTHAGQSYHLGSAAERAELHVASAAELHRLRGRLRSFGLAVPALAVGDTPSCASVDQLAEVDEIRAGNFLYFDHQQLELGSCQAADLAMVVACPVVDVYPVRGQVVVHGGAVHLSKDQSRSGAFGLLALEQGGSWTVLDEAVARVSKVSQEHGVVTAEASIVDRFVVGDIALIAPAHACLAANSLGEPLVLGPSALPMEDGT